MQKRPKKVKDRETWRRGKEKKRGWEVEDKAKEKMRRERENICPSVYTSFLPRCKWQRGWGPAVIHTHTHSHTDTHSQSAGNSVGNNRERRLLIQTNGGRWRWMREGTGEQRENCAERERQHYTEREREWRCEVRKWLNSFWIQTTEKSCGDHHFITIIMLQSVIYTHVIVYKLNVFHLSFLIIRNRILDTFFIPF